MSTPGQPEANSQTFVYRVLAIASGGVCQDPPPQPNVIVTQNNTGDVTVTVPGPDDAPLPGAPFDVQVSEFTWTVFNGLASGPVAGPPARGSGGDATPPSPPGNPPDP